jgi:hypothetical protein
MDGFVRSWWKVKSPTIRRSVWVLFLVSTPSIPVIPHVFHNICLRYCVRALHISPSRTHTTSLPKQLPSWQQSSAMSTSTQQKTSPPSQAKSYSSLEVISPLSLHFQPLTPFRHSRHRSLHRLPPRRTRPLAHLPLRTQRQSRQSLDH